jgi:hypothetical protein
MAHDHAIVFREGAAYTVPFSVYGGNEMLTVLQWILLYLIVNVLIVAFMMGASGRR